MSDKPSPPGAESLGSRFLRVATAIKVAVMGESPEAEAVPKSPSHPTDLRPTHVAPNSVGLAWTASAGAAPIHYTAFFRVHGDPYWSVGSVTTTTAAVVTGLKPGTEYDFEIFSHF